MKRLLMTMLLAALCLILSAGKWDTLTNTSRVYDMMFVGEDLYYSSWGGVVKMVPQQSLIWFDEDEVWSTANGLSSNDIRSIKYISQSQSLWLGSAFDGVNIVSQQGIQQLDTSLGLPSNNVTGIVENNSQILVATTAGMASYYYLEGVNFPLMLHQYTQQSTNGAILSNQIDAVVLADNKYLYLSSTAGINFVHLDSLDVDAAWHSFSGTPVPTGYINKMYAGHGKLLVATPTNVFSHSDDPWSSAWEVYGTGQGLVGDAISSVSMDYMGNLWVSYGSWDEDILTFHVTTDTLLTCIKSNGNVQQLAKNQWGLGDKPISRIADLFLCTWGDGIARLTLHIDGFYSSPIMSMNSIAFPKIRNIAVDDNYSAWFSSGNLNVIPAKKSALGACKLEIEYGVLYDWQTYTVADSPIHTDNIYTVAVDSRNRKWFGTYDVNASSPEGWLNGVTIYDEEANSWKHLGRWGIKEWNEATESWSAPISGSATLLGNTDLHMAQDKHGNMVIACFDDGFTVLDSLDNKIGEFIIPNSASQRGIYSYHSGDHYFIGTFNDNGLVIWNDDSIPQTNGDHWLIPDPPDLSNCEIYGVATVESPYEGTQHWVAASNGLFMWDETYWYRWDTTSKRFRYNNNTNVWDSNLLYYADEERLYGSVRTTPTAILADPFNRIWIGSLEHGISMYDPGTERFTNYFMDNSPLLSDYITALGYQPVDGKLLIGTPDGLNTLYIGRTVKPETEMGTLKIYPNPFRPGVDSAAQIINYPSDIMPRGKNSCRVYDSSGALVVVLQENEFSRFAWDGTNAKGSVCANGIYFVVVNDEKGNRLTGKIALLR